MFFTGVPGIKQDYAEALRWYLRAAELGDPDAQFNVGLIYENGLGVPQDPAEAMKWFALSAEQGDLDAQDHLDRLRAAADKQATATSSQ
jgi:TPR repeat protein